MARASYIYTVLDTNNTDDPIMVAFTVRHELVTWLGDQIDAGTDLCGMCVVRVPDGNPRWRPNTRERSPALEYWEKFK